MDGVFKTFFLVHNDRTMPDFRNAVADYRYFKERNFPLKTYQGVVASSDSVIMDRAERIYDLPGEVLADVFDVRPPDLLPLMTVIW